MHEGGHLSRVTCQSDTHSLSTDNIIGGNNILYLILSPEFIDYITNTTI